MENIEQIYTNCLAQGSYFIESAGEAAVIDPLRETDPYIDRAIDQGVKIKYIFETHFHADFVSGHLDLARKTGATIVYGPTAKTDFYKHEAFDGEMFSVGDISIKAIHTPGHTPESTCYLLLDEEMKEKALFTGDTLFIGDVGRPDLAQKATGLTQEDLAGWLYDSLRNKIMPLPDEVIIYPAHGAGSACGKNMSTETWDTLGNQKKTNYALRADMSRSEFIDELTTGLMEPPQYFALNAALNKKGYASIDEVIKTGTTPLSVEDFKTTMDEEGVLVLDVRDKLDFVNGFIPGSLFIGLDGSFAPWVGALITDINQKIILVAPEGREAEAVRRLARVGYDYCEGYLMGGIAAWQKSGEKLESLSFKEMKEFGSTLKEGDVSIVDVRKPGEFESTHLHRAVSIPLDYFLKKNFETLDKDVQHYIHCRSGYRSTIAASILYNNGFHNLVNVIGDFDALKEENVRLEGNCPSLKVS